MTDWICQSAASTGCMSILNIITGLICVFLAILFLQSGLDKVFDRKGNLEWLEGHFKGSPLAFAVSLNLTIITLLEILAGAFSAAGVLQLWFFGGKSFALLGVLLSAISIICLFFGQRLAKDYVGAAVLVNYFVLCLLGLYFLQLS